MNDKRINRISEEVRKVVSDLLLSEIKDPRISGMPSVNRVNVTKDLKFAKIYISVLGNEEEKVNTIKGLESAKGFIRKEIGRRIDLRHVPEPLFYLDETIEHAIHMLKLIDEVNNGMHEREADSDE
ncbi:30S ribosome-binding factor RbfA [Gudongella oleilytica]|jgi:ribosome-binding factor A|uniref:30S ribosome-binding factor RbfA n=1 Tax=Gudongella oleilytica TaxID=1582259 RepID=UPI000EC92400|nr:30S ribosome-binding factor RbfA [Gudongella oleilytica]MDY0255807.1 30S ribosome-binding factor RbfA [Gudongella oleilytica]HCO18359.1 30S ribosome-binding factor RbfA [Tissierellales bacterium]